MRLPPRPRVASTCYFCMVLLAVVVIFAVDNGAAKRGCAMFGHSCYGGHGKRSFQAPIPEPVVRYWPGTTAEEAQIDDVINKYYQMKRSSLIWKKLDVNKMQVYNERNMNNPPDDGEKIEETANY